MDAAREVRFEASPSRCPYCKGALEDPQRLVACAACGARHHAECHGEHGRCATCGAAPVLRPEGAPLLDAAPPRGSSLALAREGDGLRISWPAGEAPTGPAAALGALVVTLGLGALLSASAPTPLAVVLTVGGAVAVVLALLARGHPPRLELRLDPRAVEFPRHDDLGRPRPVRAALRDVGAVRATLSKASHGLTIDVGLERHPVALSRPMASDVLTGPEVDWLAELVSACARDARRAGGPGAAEAARPDPATADPAKADPAKADPAKADPKAAGGEAAAQAPPAPAPRTTGAADQAAPASAFPDPPAGARLVVERAGRVTTVRWPLGRPAFGLYALCGFMTVSVLLLPLVPLLAAAVLAQRPAPLVLDDDVLEFTPRRGGKRVRLARRAITGVRAELVDGDPCLVIDAGLERHHVATRPLDLVQPLPGPELEWLAATLDAWRRGDEA